MKRKSTELDTEGANRYRYSWRQSLERMTVKDKEERGKSLCIEVKEKVHGSLAGTLNLTLYHTNHFLKVFLWEWGLLWSSQQIKLAGHPWGQVFIWSRAKLKGNNFSSNQFNINYRGRWTIHPFYQQQKKLIMQLWTQNCILSLVLTVGSVLCHMPKLIRWDSNRTKQFKFTMTAITNAWQTASKRVFWKQQSNTK